MVVESRARLCACVSPLTLLNMYIYKKNTHKREEREDRGAEKWIEIETERMGESTHENFNHSRIFTFTLHIYAICLAKQGIFVR